jgi:hypothetical protein
MQLFLINLFLSCSTCFRRFLHQPSGAHDRTYSFGYCQFCNFTFLQFYTGIYTTVQNNNNEISLHFKPMRFICMNYSVYSIVYLWPDDGRVIEAETCSHLVTLNKISILNISRVLTCESLLPTCIALRRLSFLCSTSPLCIDLIINRVI